MATLDLARTGILFCLAKQSVLGTSPDTWASSPTCHACIPPPRLCQGSYTLWLGYDTVMRRSHRVSHVRACFPVATVGQQHKLVPPPPFPICTQEIELDHSPPTTTIKAPVQYGRISALNPSN